MKHTFLALISFTMFVSLVPETKALTTIDERRLIVELYANDTIQIKGEAFSIEQMQAVIKVVSKFDPKAPIYLRAEKTTTINFIKRVVKAASEAGMSDVIFQSIQKDKRKSKTN